MKAKQVKKVVCDFLMAHEGRDVLPYASGKAISVKLVDEFDRVSGELWVDGYGKEAYLRLLSQYCSWKGVENPLQGGSPDV